MSANDAPIALSGNNYVFSLASIVIFALNSLDTGQPSFALLAISSNFA
jgi:hypothetical protein